MTPERGFCYKLCMNKNNVSVPVSETEVSRVNWCIMFWLYYRKHRWNCLGYSDLLLLRPTVCACRLLLDWFPSCCLKINFQRFSGFFFFSGLGSNESVVLSPLIPLMEIEIGGKRERCSAYPSIHHHVIILQFQDFRKALVLGLHN